MGEIALKEGAQTPKQKKKGMPGFFKFLIIFVSVIIGLALIIVVAAFICFYDKSHKEIEVKENYPTERVFNELMVDSLDNASTTKKMSFALTESQLNQIIYNAFKDQEEAQEYIKNFYVEVNDGKFDFVLEVQAVNFIKTRLVINTELTIDEEQLVFNISNIKVGKIGGFQKFINILTQYVSVSDLNNSLSNVGLHMNFDINNLKITYALSDFYSDIINLVGDSDSDFMSIFKEIINLDSLRTISSTGKNLFALDVNLNELVVTEQTTLITGYNAPTGYFDTISASIMNDVKTLLNNGVISEENASTVANYFLGGETLLSNDEKSIINTYKENATFNAYTYERYDYNADPSTSLKAKVASQIVTTLPPSSQTIYITTDDLDNMFSTSTALGKYTLFLRDVNEGTALAKDYKINYVNIDRISTAFSTIADKSMYIILDVNFNGQATQITLKCNKMEGEFGFGTLKLSIADLYLGDVKVSEDTKTKFVNLISSAMNSGSFDDLFVISEGILTLNLKSTLDENGVLELLGYQTSFAFSANTSSTPGSLIIHADI